MSDDRLQPGFNPMAVILKKLKKIKKNLNQNFKKKKQFFFFFFLTIEAVKKNELMNQLFFY